MSLGAQLPSAAAALERLVRGEPWLLGVLAAARACGAPDCWVGGGVLRDLVWDQLHGGFDPARVKDVDVAFYDPSGLTPEADQVVEATLRALGNRLVGILHGCLAHRVAYQEQVAWPAAEPAA